jgi:hypothetical protein
VAFGARECDLPRRRAVARHVPCRALGGQGSRCPSQCRACRRRVARIAPIWKMRLKRVRLSD